MSASDFTGGHAPSIASHPWGSAPTLDEVPDDRDHCDYQEEVNESSYYGKDKKAQCPKDDEHERNGEEHGCSAN